VICCSELLLICDEGVLDMGKGDVEVKYVELVELDDFAPSCDERTAPIGMLHIDCDFFRNESSNVQCSLYPSCQLHLCKVAIDSDWAVQWASEPRQLARSMTSRCAPQNTPVTSTTGHFACEH
jgi:hypothetical protein